MRINHPLINKTQLAKESRIDKDYLYAKLKTVNGKHIDKFTKEEQARLKETYIELFEYIFDIEYIHIKEFIEKK